jgi:hypothetical protein
MLTFEVVDASLIEKFGGTVDIWDAIKDRPEKPIAKPESATRLSFRVRIADGEKVMLTEGERLNKLRGSVTVYPQIGSLDEKSKGIGVMSYFPHEPGDSTFPEFPASYTIEVLLPQTQFNNLVSAARIGRIPSSMTIEERGMKLPDEFSKEWDNKSSPKLHVASVSFSIPLSGGDENPESQELAQTRFLPPTQTHIFRLENDVRMLNESLQRIDSKMKWLVGLIGLLSLITLVVKH